MASPVQPLDFESIISYAIGDATLFVYIAIVVLSILAAKYRIPISAYLLLMLLFSMMMFSTIGFGLMVFILFIVAVWLILSFLKGIKQ